MSPIVWSKARRWRRWQVPPRQPVTGGMYEVEVRSAAGPQAGHVRAVIRDGEWVSTTLAAFVSDPATLDKPEARIRVEQVPVMFTVRRLS